MLQTRSLRCSALASRRAAKLSTPLNPPASAAKRATVTASLGFISNSILSLVRNVIQVENPSVADLKQQQAARNDYRHPAYAVKTDDFNYYAPPQPLQQQISPQAQPPQPCSIRFFVLLFVFLMIENFRIFHKCRPARRQSHNGVKYSPPNENQTTPDDAATCGGRAWLRPDARWFDCDYFIILNKNN